MKRQRTNTFDTPPKDYSESLKVITTMLTLMEANIKKETDVYVRQISIAKNDLWIASLYIAVSIGLFERAFDVSAKLVNWSCFEVFRLALFTITLVTAAWIFFSAFRITWGNFHVEYASNFENGFKEGMNLSSQPKPDEELYAHCVSLLGGMTDSFNDLTEWSERRGNRLRRIGYAIQVCLFLVVANIAFYLLSKIGISLS
mgnify:FL=1